MKTVNYAVEFRRLSGRLPYLNFTLYLSIIFCGRRFIRIVRYIGLRYFYSDNLVSFLCLFNFWNIFYGLAVIFQYLFQLGCRILQAVGMADLWMRSSSWLRVGGPSRRVRGRLAGPAVRVQATHPEEVVPVQCPSSFFVVPVNNSRLRFLWSTDLDRKFFVV